MNLAMGKLFCFIKMTFLEFPKMLTEYFPKKPSMPNKWELPDNLPKQRRVVNNKRLIFYKKHEIKVLKKQLKEIKSNYSKEIRKMKKENKKKVFKKRDLRLMSIGNALSIINEQNQGVENEKKNTGAEK